MPLFFGSARQKWWYQRLNGSNQLSSACWLPLASILRMLKGLRVVGPVGFLPHLSCLPPLPPYHSLFPPNFTSSAVQRFMPHLWKYSVASRLRCLTHAPSLTFPATSTSPPVYLLRQPPASPPCNATLLKSQSQSSSLSRKTVALPFFVPHG